MAVQTAAPTPALTRPDRQEGSTLQRKQRWFLAFETNKRRELAEAREARQYYHDQQWTDTEIDRLRKRGQQATVRNRIKRKVDFLVGIEQRLRRDPKAYPRTPQHTQEADTATAALRYVCDENQWPSISSVVMHNGIVSGIGAVFIGIRNADPVIEEVAEDRFFYDPRSVKADFSDARYMGVHLWLDIDEAKERWPDQATKLDAMIDAAGTSVTPLVVEQDRDQQWADLEGRRVRVVEFWEKRGPGWYFCFFTGDVELEANDSPYVDEDGKTVCPYEAWSPYIDQRGDRYGIVRTLKSIQDEINYSASKMLHRISTRQFFYKEGFVDDPNEFSQQLARPDGKIKLSPQAKWGEDVGLVDDSTELRGEVERHGLAIQEMENYGPNPGLVGQGQGVDGASGRALLAQRDSGMTELSPVFERQRDWKLRCYRAMWARVRQAWTGEKFIRVTDDERSIQFVPLNQYGIDPATGQIQAQNVVAEIDVDIILDEGPDTITVNEEILDQFTKLGEAAMGPLGKIVIELSNTPKKEMLLNMIDEAMQPQGPPPEVMIEQQKHEATMAQMEAKSKMDEMRLKADMQLKDADLQLKEMEIQQKQLEAETARNMKMMELDFDREKHDRDMERIDREYVLDLERMLREGEAHQAKMEMAEKSDARKADREDKKAAAATKPPSGPRAATVDDIGEVIKVMMAPRELEVDAKTGRKRTRVVMEERNS